MLCCPEKTLRKVKIMQKLKLINAKSIKRLLVLVKKSLRLTHLLNRNAQISNLFQRLNTLKLSNKSSLEICILICKYFDQAFKNWFTLATTSLTYNTRRSNSNCLRKLHNTNMSGRYSASIGVIYNWNSMPIYVNI